MNKFEEMYQNSFYTIVGAGGDINDWKRQIQSMLNLNNIGHVRKWIAFTGDEMNKHYHLTDDNAYPDDLHFLAFSPEGLNIGKLAAFRMQMRDRWFDDIVANDLNREFGEYHYHNNCKPDGSFVATA